MSAVLGGALSLLSACATPVSENVLRDIGQQAAPPTPVQGTPVPPDLGRVVIQGLQDASWNLDQAIVVKALAPDDPAPKCLHDILTQLGIDPANPQPPAASFTPRVSDLVSAGSVLYIRAKQLQGAAGRGVVVSGSCKELVATIMLDAAAGAARGLPGGGLVPVLR